MENSQKNKQIYKKSTTSRINISWGGYEAVLTSYAVKTGN